MGRMAALDAGFDPRVPGVTLDRFCGGALTAIGFAAGQIMSGLGDCVIAGGTEMLSQINALAEAEYVAGIPQYGMGAGNDRLQAAHPQSNQGVAADAIAAQEGITRLELDRLGLESQRRAARAINEGRFARSIVPVRSDGGDLILERDEYPRPETTMEGLSALKPAFARIADMPIGEGKPTYRQEINRRYPDLQIEPLHHAGNSSGVVDGAAAILLASPEMTQRMGWRPRARIVAVATVGDDPTLMLNAPVPAARAVLEKARLSVDGIDLWEVNEAFAVVVEKFIRDLGLDRETVNVNGGAIALGHPVGATGAILVGTLLDELERTGKRRGLVTMCAAGGMAPAIIIERCDD